MWFVFQISKSPKEKRITLSEKKPPLTGFAGWNKGNCLHNVQFSITILSLFLGNPVWPGTELTVNTCDNLDWLRAFGTHLWYLTSPAASISDALNLYEEAFQKETTQFGAYAKAPCPTYIVENTTNDSSAEDIFDIRFHLLKLYGNKAHKIESIVVPKTYTDQPLDNKLGWLVSNRYHLRIFQQLPHQTLG